MGSSYTSSHDKTSRPSHRSHHRMERDAGYLPFSAVISTHANDLSPFHHSNSVSKRLRQFLYRPVVIILLLILTVVHREYGHYHSKAAASAVLDLNQSFRTSKNLLTPTLLLRRNVTRDQLPIWQSSDILVEGQGRRRNPLLPSEELKIGEFRGR